MTDLNFGGRQQVEGFEPTPSTAPSVGLPESPANGGIKGRRPSKKDKLRAAAAKTRR